MARIPTLDADDLIPSDRLRSRSGTRSQRIAAAHIANTDWFETDTGDWWFDTGSAWVFDRATAFWHTKGQESPVTPTSSLHAFDTSTRVKSGPVWGADSADRCIISKAGVYMVDAHVICADTMYAVLRHWVGVYPTVLDHGSNVASSPGSGNRFTIKLSGVIFAAADDYVATSATETPGAGSRLLTLRVTRLGPITL